MSRHERRGCETSVAWERSRRLDGQAVAIGRLQFVTERGRPRAISRQSELAVEELEQGRGRSLVFVVAGAEKGVVALEDQDTPRCRRVH